MRIGTEFHYNKTIIIQSWIFLEGDKKYLVNLWMNFDKTGRIVWFGGTYVRKSPIFRLPTPAAYNIVPDQKKKREWYIHSTYLQQTQFYIQLVYRA